LTLTNTSSGPKYLEVICGLFTGLLIVTNICSNRLIALGPLEFDAGTLMFPLTYIFGDLLTEVYGFQRSRRVIWTGFAALFLATICLYLASLFPPPEGWEGAAAWDTALALTPRIALGSLAAYLLGGFANSITLSKMKSLGYRGGVGWRFIASTLVGQFFDTIVFACIAFLGVLGSSLWLTLVISNYVYKVGFEIILLPVTLAAVRKLKKAENLDAIDYGVNLTPFGWKVEDLVSQTPRS
jgi:uncharacterized integral membrane protein (TIGR00697 family)